MARVSGPVTGGSKGWPFGGPVLDFAALECLAVADARREHVRQLRLCAQDFLVGTVA